MDERTTSLSSGLLHRIRPGPPQVLVTNWKLKGQQHMAQGLMGLPN